ncbi:MAG: hypothetical protein QF893_20705 [Alphaproteobacteria bacterium]|nr:hypothetical protein [Alphaproteobacteria bacterium]
MVHDLAHVRAALASAAAAATPAHLVTPPGGAHYAGPDFYAEIVRIAAAEHPAATYRLTLDCGDDAALAITALGQGWTSLVLGGGAKPRAKVTAVASRFQATLFSRRPKALDLGNCDDAAAVCRKLHEQR